MRLRLRYGTLVDPTGKLAWRPARVVDDVLGLRVDDEYPNWLHRRYAPLIHPAEAFPPSGPETATVVMTEVEPLGSPGSYLAEWLELSEDEFKERFRALDEQQSEFAKWLEQQTPEQWLEDLRSLVRFVLPEAKFSKLNSVEALRDSTLRGHAEEIEGLRQRFTEAASRAAEGTYSPEIAADLARVKWLDGGEIEVHDLPALAAWSLLELLRSGPVKLTPCDLCGLPWLGERGASYCKRPAPGHVGTCQAVATQARYREANPAYHRERKRLHERVRRGSLPRKDYEAWRANNSPGNWSRFEEWEQARTRRRKEK